MLDAKQLLLNPRGVLSELCQRLSLPIDAAMPTWPAGPRPEDGLWAKHWYHNVHESTGFAPYQPKTDPFPNRLRPLLAECQPLYAVLKRQVIEVGD